MLSSLPLFGYLHFFSEAFGNYVLCVYEYLRCGKIPLLIYGSKQEEMCLVNVNPCGVVPGDLVPTDMRPLCKYQKLSSSEN